jgi:hypothetical protein
MLFIHSPATVRAYWASFSFSTHRACLISRKELWKLPFFSYWEKIIIPNNNVLIRLLDDMKSSFFREQKIHHLLLARVALDAIFKTVSNQQLLDVLDQTTFPTVYE